MSLRLRLLSEGTYKCSGGPGTEGSRLLAGIRLGVRMDVNDKHGADGRERTCLLEQVSYLTRGNDEQRMNIRAALRSSLCFLA